MHILPCSVSDHRPIKLELSAHWDKRPTPFKFNPLWIKEQSFLQLVKDMWKQPVNGSLFFVWEEKLGKVKAALKVWAKSLPNPTVERKKLQEHLEIHQLNSENEEIIKEILEKGADLQQKLLKASLAEEEYWRIKSRRLWLKAGDRNTSFFHKQAQARKNSNSIIEIREENSIHRDTQSIKNVAFQHFKKLYNEKEEQAKIPLTVNEVPKRISNRKNQSLEAEVTNNEIKTALFSMEPDKALGPDGFTARFLQHCWQIIEKYLCRMVRKSQNCQKIGGSTNSAFLTLIPKERGANSFSRFCPISLCNIGYKMITKVIAKKLKAILPDIIPENQGGFIQGRLIADNYTLVQEAIHSSLARKEQGMIIKLDLESAFDRVRHRFLLEVLHKFGFGHKFINWIKACISEPWIAPLVNGRATDFFKASRGLRQGCPLSPLLFVLQASALSFLLNRKQTEQEIMGINIARGVKSINHALFADDTLLLGAASVVLANRFKEVVDDYCADSGSKLNKGKCQVYCWNTSTRLTQAISICLGFTASSTWTSFKYLGLPVFQKKILSREWMPLLDKFKLKIQSWGYNWLNLAGRTVLIKSILNSLPIFQATVMMAPMGIMRKMEEYIKKKKSGKGAKATREKSHY